MSNAAAAVRSPSEIARETIRQLASRKLPPTPDNYADIYGELSGVAPTESAAVLRNTRQLCAATGRTPPTAALAPLERALFTRDSAQVRAAIAALFNDEARQRPEWANLMRELLQQWDTRNVRWTQARKRESVEHVLTAFAGDPVKLAEKLTSLLKAWSERSAQGSAEMALIGAAPEACNGALPASERAGVETSAASAIAAGPVTSTVPPALLSLVVSQEREPDAAQQTAAASGEAYVLLRDMSVELLKLAIGDGLYIDACTFNRATELINGLKAAQSAAEFIGLTPKVQALVRMVRREQGTQREAVQGLLGLLQLIVSNIEELVPDERWVKGQVERLRSLIAGPLDSESLTEAEQAFRDVIDRQGDIRKSLDEAKAALKEMLASFIGRLGMMSDSTGDYEHKVQSYAEKIEKVDDISQLPAIIKGLLDDTRMVQSEMVRTRDELLLARQRATDHEHEIERLESELVDVSKLLKADQLTGVLNRRGLNEAFAGECSRGEREGRSLCVARLAVDNFKTLNDTHGHAVGDRALQHLAQVVRDTVRPSDIVARYGGEEFVVVLPNTSKEEAVEVMTRVQRQLTRAFFLQENKRLLITFSAGVAQRAEGEPQSAALTRADAALYHAKGSGKNRVVCA
jgi:diguanylate cyclase